jgi:serine/threonine-protein kinase
MYYLRESKNIAKLVGFSDSPFCLLMKIYPHGSLDGWIYSPSKKSLVLVWKFLIDICRVRAMHSKDLAHCDLKPQNVLLDQDQSGMFCVITDFGITQIVSDKNLLVKAFNVVNIRGASINYAPPEALLRVRKRQEISGTDLLKCDVYAIGVIMYEMMTRSNPWK